MDLNHFNSLRNVKHGQEDALIEYLDSHSPSLKSDILNITSVLLPIIEDRCLPDQKLQLEVLSPAQIASGELENRSLKELFEYSDNCSNFLAEAFCYDSSQTQIRTPLNHLVGYGSVDMTTDLPRLDVEHDLVTESRSDWLFLTSPEEPNWVS